MATTSSNPYSEDNNIQEPAARLMEEHLGWRSVYAFNAETFGPGSLLGRSSPRAVGRGRDRGRARPGLRQIHQPSFDRHAPRVGRQRTPSKAGRDMAAP